VHNPLSLRLTRDASAKFLGQVSRGLSRLQDVGWESDTNETIKRVEVEIHQEPTKHIVDVPKLLKWIEQNSMYPGQETRKEKLRKLLGKR